MSVAAASGAVSTQHHRATQEQIRLAQLIDDKKHDQPEVQEIVRKVLDVVANSNTEDILLALFDCDYDYERAVALLIEKGHEVASEWRTATNHKLTKKQQQKLSTTKNGHGESDENGQQRSNDIRGKTRGSRSRFQQNGGDSQHTTNNQTQQSQPNDGSIPARGGSAYRGRYRGQNRAGHRPTDRTYSQQPQDSHVDSSVPSDTAQRLPDVPYVNRRGRGSANSARHQTQEQWDVGNWNGETLIYSRTTKDEEQPSNFDETSNVLSEVSNGSMNSNKKDKSKPDFDPIEATRQIKNVIGIGQPPKPLMDIKPLMFDQKSKVKSSGQPSISKVTSSPPLSARIPHQPVIFSDRFDGGANKIDVQFGNLSESFDESLAQHIAIPTSSSAFYHHHSEPLTSITKQNHNSFAPDNSQRATEQSLYNSPSMRLTEQPVINQQRLLPSQMHQQQQQQQPSIPMKPVVTSQYALHQQQQQQQQQMNGPSMFLQSLQSLHFHHPQQQQESVTLDNTYDPNAFPLSPIDFTTPFYMATPMNPQPQQQAHARYVVSQPPPLTQQSTSNRQASSTNIHTPPVPNIPTSSVSASSSVPKKGPAIPPGIFPPTGPPTQPVYSTAYSTAYGIPPTIGGQQQASGAGYSTPYDAEHSFTNALMQLANTQQVQSPSGTYGSVTPPVQQQQQQQQGNNTSTENKAMNYRGPFNENLMLLQQYTLQQSNSQQQGQQTAAHSAAQMNYFLSRPPTGPSYSPGHPIMYAQPAALAHQAHVPKQQGQQYHQNPPSSGLGVNDDYYPRGSSSNKEPSYMYTVPTQTQHMPSQSVGQQQNVNKQQQQQQQQQRTNANVYNNQQRSYQ